MSRNSVKIAPGAVVCSECELKGDITIGTRTVIHPRARIIAEAGPIIIGENNLIEEQAEICNRDDGKAQSGNKQVMMIGNFNVFEVASRTESMKIGDHNVLEAKAVLGHNTILSNGCIIGSMCTVTTNEVLPENTVVYGSRCERRVQQERPQPQTLQLDFLTKILPNYHHLKKPTPSAIPATAK